MASAVFVFVLGVFCHGKRETTQLQHLPCLSIGISIPHTPLLRLQAWFNSSYKCELFSTAHDLRCAVAVVVMCFVAGCGCEWCAQRRDARWLMQQETHLESLRRALAVTSLSFALSYCCCYWWCRLLDVVQPCWSAQHE